jgi:carotenoid cleavage dioxygenase
VFAPPTARPRPPLRPIDVSTEPCLQGVFAPVIEEVDAPDLPVEGELPPAIEGDYIRNGPNPRFTPLGAYIYPMDGDGMLHRVQIRDGRARYTNRFVRTPALIAEEAAGQALWPGVAGLGREPGAELVGPALANTLKDVPDVNIVRHGGRLLALAESTTPFLMSPELATIGRETFCDTLPAGITAHPKIDPATGEMVVFTYNISAPYLTWSVIDRDGLTRRAATPVDGVERPVMIHDMALTASFVVLVLAPLYFDIAAAMRGGSPLSWEPDHGTRIALIPRDGGRVRWLTTDAFWLWHTANAYEVATSESRGPSVVLDFARWSNPGVLAGVETSVGSLTRLHLDPDSGRVDGETLIERPVEFPRIDDRRLTHPHSVTAVSFKTDRDLFGADQDTLGWYDTATGVLTQWGAGAELAVGEQAFIPRPGDDDPSRGWWTTIATHRPTLTSQLLVFSAAEPAAGPIARVHLPRRVPAGLHGNWLPAYETA